ncbi:MAG: GNAT family N-acetyltransferase [Ruminococcaceae bacterium]|nr:GNAT family N-acetyltransferase [Oscillospiraceae bacterium]
MQLRTSHIEDGPRLRELWKLAFGDDDAYIDHFFTRYYAPERMLVLEEDGQVQAMTAWFDMPLVFANGTRIAAAYLYAVATHPDCRGRGLAGQLLAFADDWLKEQGFDCVTTVPARPDLHVFFCRNGFVEAFALTQRQYSPNAAGMPAVLRAVGAEEYALLREGMLTGTDHVSYSRSALDYQRGVCQMSGGGLYRIGERGCACVELAGDEVFVKELLVPETERETAQVAIAQRYPAKRYWVRGPYTGQGEKWEFAMIKWLVAQSGQELRKDAYLGLAFD